MTETLVSTFAEPMRAIWRDIERGDAKAVIAAQSAFDTLEAGSEAAGEASLLRALAWQNAGNHAEAFQAAQPALGCPAPYDVWARAERRYAARARAELQVGANESLTDADAVAALASGSPWGALVAARIRLALGLEAIQGNHAEDAESLLLSSLDLMHTVGSDAGKAVVSLELGKLKAWRGRSEDSFRYLLSGLAIWRTLDEQRATGIWHELGSALLDARRFEEAASILQATYNDNKTTRTRNALTRALIGLGRLGEAEGHASAVLAEEQAARASNPKRDAYREVMALRDLAEIALRKRSSPDVRDAGVADDLLEAADTRFNEAIKLQGDPRTPNSSLFSVWMGSLDKATRAGGKDTVDFGQMRLMQLELLLISEKRPAEAARNLAKVADVYGQRGERTQELEAREQAAEAASRDSDYPRAAQQLELGMRAAEMQGLGAVAQHLRSKLEAIASQIPGRAAAPGFLVRGVERVFPFGRVIAASEVASGRRVRIHRFDKVPAALADKARDGLAALERMFADSRVLAGLPTLVQAPPALEKGQAPASFDLIVESAEGEQMAQAMEASTGDWRRAVRIIRDLSFTIGVMHQARLTDCRPDPEQVVLDLGDNPIYLDILPLHADAQRPPIEDVKALARLLHAWITGEVGKLKSRSIAFKPGQMRRLFTQSRDGPPDRLDELLSGILLHNRQDAPTPLIFADRLQPFCGRID